MRKLVYILSIALIAVACNGGEQEGKIDQNIISNPATGSSEKDIKRPLMEFEKPRQEFGIITEGETITKTFKFTNAGEADLVIYNIYNSCGCTTAKDWPKDPIAPGEEGEFTVTFDSKGKSGQQVKKIKVEANTYPSLNVVALAGYVNKKQEK